MPEEEKKGKKEREELRALRSEEIELKKDAIRSAEAEKIKEVAIRSAEAEKRKAQAQKETEKE